MSGNTTMTAEPRDRAGKGAARATRRSGRVPAVIYGDHKDPILVSVEPVELMRHLHKPGFFSMLMDLNVAGDHHRVLPRDVQFHPVTDAPLHVDFMRIGKGTRITVMIPIQVEDEDKCKGIKRGGVLNQVRHEVEVRCDPENIPDMIVLSLEGLDIGDALRISDAGLPDDVKPTITDRDFVLVTIAAPTVVKDEAAEAQAEAEAEAEEGEEGEDEEGGEE
ncbi:MAG TPA: 50S ribosomal protein L25 [Rhodospirillaceae bacterium]|nr:50S ribosomal protein L25/general stress protein Ctc [Magnetovibrio sp.]HBT40764.1 50S ribosomal protein L25 [Rhodospirillaceae bacterium]HCS68692.1 50S ribosomal protein L25 [Rhodospirillaceae bacterium]|tara:strand:- start:2029 stop:2688 length:660 start_codon:yes stop_codon:yes gene_type:complete